jgi:hypothetical protein
MTTHRKPSENQRNLRRPTETQGPWPGLMGFCISAITVQAQDKHARQHTTRQHTTRSLTGLWHRSATNKGTHTVPPPPCSQDTMQAQNKYGTAPLPTEAHTPCRRPRAHKTQCKLKTNMHSKWNNKTCQIRKERKITYIKYVSWHIAEV